MWVEQAEGRTGAWSSPQCHAQKAILCHLPRIKPTPALPPAWVLGMEGSGARNGTQATVLAHSFMRSFYRGLMSTYYSCAKPWPVSS